MERVRLWPINTLPAPYVVVFGEGSGAGKEPEILEDDNFPKGRVHKFFPNQRSGVISDRAGRKILFKLAEMDLVGSKGEDAVREGAAVGYDLSHSGAGLHVKRMKIY